jgi:hypothetical protein
MNPPTRPTDYDPDEGRVGYHDYIDWREAVSHGDRIALPTDPTPSWVYGWLSAVYGYVTSDEDVSEQAERSHERTRLYGGTDG